MSPAPAAPRPGGHLRAVLLRDPAALAALARGTPGATRLRPERLHVAAFLGHGAARRALRVRTRPPRDIERWAKALEFWGGPGAVVAATLGLLTLWEPEPRALPPHFCEAWAEFAREEDPRRLAQRLNHFWGSEATRALGWPGGALHGLCLALRAARQGGASVSRARAAMRFAAFVWACEALATRGRRR